MRYLFAGLAAVLVVLPAAAKHRAAPPPPATAAPVAPAAAAPANAAPAAAATPVAAPTPERIKGTIVSLTGSDLTIKTPSKQTVVVTLAANAKVIGNEKSALADIKPNDFVATTAAAGTDGKLKALEVRIFPEILRGFGEGQYPSGTPNQLATNATVQDVGVAAKGKPASLKLSFYGTLAGANNTCSGHAAGPGKGPCNGQADLQIGPKVPVMRWVLGDLTWLEPGKAVSLYVTVADNGKLSTPGVIVEHGGNKPAP